MPELRARETSLRHQIDALDSPTRRPRGLPQTRRQPRRLPHRAARQGRHRDRRRTPARPAPARQRRPRRPRQDHHPPLHPGPAQRRAAGPTTAPKPTRRAKYGLIANCVGGVITPPCGVPSSVGAKPLPGSITPAFSHRRSCPRGERRRSRRVGGRGRSGRTPPPDRRPAIHTRWAVLRHSVVEDGLRWRLAAAARPEPVDCGVRTEPPTRVPARSGPVPDGTDPRSPGCRVGAVSPLAFGMYTRLTAQGCQVWTRACIRTARSVLRRGVNATSPSIPAVVRPALRCVTCRTLTSVLVRLRNINFCRFLTFGQSPSCVALKIRCRSRRTCSS